MRKLLGLKSVLASVASVKRWWTVGFGYRVAPIKRWRDTFSSTTMYWLSLLFSDRDGSVFMEVLFNWTRLGFSKRSLTPLHVDLVLKILKIVNNENKNRWSWSDIPLSFFVYWVIGIYERSKINIRWERSWDIGNAYRNRKDCIIIIIDYCLFIIETRFFEESNKFYIL